MQQLDSETLQVPSARRPPSKASEQGKPLFARREFIGRRFRDEIESAWEHVRGEVEEVTATHGSCICACRCSLRVSILRCCAVDVDARRLLTKIVLLQSGCFDTPQGKIVLRTLAKLTSDKTHIPLQYQPFPSDYLVTLPPAQQHQNPLCCSYVLPTRASAKCLRPQDSFPYFIPLTFLIAEGLGYQVKIPQAALYHEGIKVVPS
jgi:hypothetical protein